MRYYLLHVEGTDDEFYTYMDKNSEYEIGDWVLVNFINRDRVGLIIKESSEENFDYKVKSIKHRLDGYYKIPKYLIALYLWIKSYYLEAFRDVLKAAYPKNLKLKYSYKYKFVKEPLRLSFDEIEILEYMKKKGEIGVATLKKNFSKELVEKFEKEGVIKKEKVLVESKKKIDESKFIFEGYKESTLTKEQKDVKDKIENSEEPYHLIRGVTGSGKTEVYIELVKNALKNGDGSIFLVPEISLTPQMVKRFRYEFQDNIAILHSRLGDANRGREWSDIYNGKKQVVLGVRSAVFAPVKNLKYIIIDEEHETTYKQDSAPRYHTRFVAIKRCELEGAKLVLGSATPSIESYNYAKKGYFVLSELEKRYNDYTLPEISIVDMKKEESKLFSLKMLHGVSKRLGRGEQVLIFINRKGFANYVQCDDCGHIEKCVNCSVSYNYYKNDSKLKCSYCGRVETFRHKCSSCGSGNLSHGGYGTERIQEELFKIFPEARILRVDSDTVKEKDAYERIYNDFLSGKYDIIVGTQMIAKGFHFPNITLAVILSADSTLNFPDFRAGEKTFQLIVQAAGRSGRGEKSGEVILQTLEPDNYVIEYSVKSDYKGFYEEEVEIREVFNYPPFGKIINIIVSSPDENSIHREATKVFKEIKIDGVEIYGPFQAPLYRIKGRYRYQIFAKGDKKGINRLKKRIRDYYSHKKSDDLRVIVDIDPVNLM